jgi:hypothetical protein
MDPTWYQDIQTALGRAGLVARGGFVVAPDDPVPSLSDGRPTRTVVLAGNVGPAMWEAFTKARVVGPAPLDSWSRSILESIAVRYDANVVMPSDGPPYIPFQRWAMRAEPVHSSPLGILIHPRWGLWHGYRGALLFATTLDLPNVEALASPCDSCEGKPCLSACPVGAFTGSSYRVGACATHVRAPAGTECRRNGCLARHACPIGQTARPSPGQASFHMAAFLSSRPR